MADTGTKQNEAEARKKYYEGSITVANRRAASSEKAVADNADYHRRALAQTGAHQSAIEAQGNRRLDIEQGHYDAMQDQAQETFDANQEQRDIVNRQNQQRNNFLYPNMDGAVDTSDVGGAYVPPAPAPGMAKGGVVKKYAAGGAIDPDDDDEGDEDDATQETASDEETMPEMLERWSKGNNPVTIAMDAAMKTHGFDRPAAAVDTGKAHPGVASLMRAEGAMNDDELRALNEAVDPQHKLSESALAMARLDKMVNFYVDHGDMKRAATTAQALLARGQLDSQKFGAAAVQAVQKGDMKSAVAFIKRAYDNVPDGSDLEATVDQQGNVHGVITDGYGEKKDLGAFGPQQVFQLARNVASGSDYYNRMAGIAAGHIGRPQAAAQEKGGAAMKPKDFKDLEADVGTAFEKLHLDTKDERIDSTIQNTATHLASDPRNRAAGMTADEAARSAAMIALPNPKDPTPDFSSRQVQGGMAVTFGGGRQMFVPQSQWDQLAAIRGQQLKGINGDASKKRRSAERYDAGEQTERRESAKVSDEIGSQGTGL